eukprot:gnl/TRDRNA2_/TRDRNA2_189945_c0_seq1.p1 gnl/TRDRNA2_/TRDRNA2_189945_c0~~gnl/TRDRNA2_/TRDRNA2_189945_c0_seq1.p1  ORF type:complete len:188 (-),score=27.47 gnl/TRDRNA2_/TRDRNA2_189945_c0_seq1:180-743(-)
MPLSGGCGGQFLHDHAYSWLGIAPECSSGSSAEARCSSACHLLEAHPAMLLRRARAADVLSAFLDAEKPKGPAPVPEVGEDGIPRVDEIPTCCNPQGAEGFNVTCNLKTCEEDPRFASKKTVAHHLGPEMKHASAYEHCMTWTALANHASKYKGWASGPSPPNPLEGFDYWKPPPGGTFLQRRHFIL